MDRSPAHNRRWGSMRRRGNRTKVALPGAGQVKQQRRVTGVPPFLPSSRSPRHTDHCTDEAQSPP
ncbi:CGNR zinc finger domain-containing protein [Streptomyces sp. MMG1533]|uniref:CGNR zinc finger domain-containing protein n=1 Tax=Streptomyces sp. MMG1533 TaxID=1415546 RepID=UPI00099B4125|nr:CGNR zinc finger domain-containing protein [Streptomyces sp. MMG1533]